MSLEVAEASGDGGVNMYHPHLHNEGVKNLKKAVWRIKQKMQMFTYLPWV